VERHSRHQPRRARPRPLEKQIVPEGGVENNGGFYINPFPMSEKAFLVGHDMLGDESEFALYYIDVWGNRELLHRDRDMSCFMPYPLRKRVTPPVVADTVNPDMDYGTVFLENAYRDLPGVEKGDVKHLRISQRLFLPAPVDLKDNSFNHLHYLPGDSTSYHFSYWTWAPTRTVGIVDVEPDGSAYFKVPAGTPIFLQALDENYCEIRRERTFWMVQRGEFRGCTGCHESRLEAVGTKPVYPKATLDKGPQTPKPPRWGINTTLDYRQHVQPILDKHCVSCHDEKEPSGGLEFTRRETGGFMQSYRTMFGLKWDDPTPVLFMKWHQVLNPEAKNDKYSVKKKNGKYPDRGDRETQDILKKMEQNQWPGMLVSISNRHDDSDITMPYQFGSNKSKLIRTLLDNEKYKKIRAKMSEEEWLRLVTWVDYNAIYHTTVINVREYSDNNQVLTRVPYYLPTPWKPADINPSFLNTADIRKAPVIPEGNEYVPE
jgi:hypothetical protein